MVLLPTLIRLYQERLTEVDLKYGDRDISESSLVFLRSKDEGAG